MIPIIIIEGATASGKSALALKMAHRFGTEIISADSRQVYKYLNIGTAKPTKDELQSIKHHMIDIINPDQGFNAGLFSKKATSVIRRLNKLGKIPIICGGTGLYIKALLEGLFKADVNDPEIRDRLNIELAEKGLGLLYEELVRIDAVAAAKISCNDRQRILRALEVYRLTGYPISEHWKKQERKLQYIPFRILLEEDRNILYKRIDTRILAMVDAGLIDEIKAILARGYKWSDPGFNSVGYKEFKPFFDKEMTLDSCLTLAQQHTRNYAKRQITWYRKCSFNLAGSPSSIKLDSVEVMINQHFDRITSEAQNGNSCSSI
jgi:tRNA dimethylallyltransferase